MLQYSFDHLRKVAFKALLPFLFSDRGSTLLILFILQMHPGIQATLHPIVKIANSFEEKSHWVAKEQRSSLVV